MLNRKLDTIVRDITAKAAAALQAPTPDAQIEQILAARDESAERMLKLERRQSDIGVAGFFGVFPGMGMMIAGATGFLAAPSLAAVTGVLLATPLFTAGLALAAVSLGTMMVMGAKVDRLRADRDTIEKGLNREAQKIAQAHPDDVKKSPRFLQSLWSVFNRAAAADDGSYQELKQRVALNKTPAPAVTGTAL